MTNVASDLNVFEMFFHENAIFFSALFLGKSNNNNNNSNQKLSPTKVNKTPTKNNLKTTKTSSKAASPAKLNKTNKTSSSGGDSSLAVSPEKKATSETKSFTTFSENSDQVNANEKDKENENENDCAKNVEEDSSPEKSEGIAFIVE